MSDAGGANKVTSDAGGANKVTSDAGLVPHIVLGVSDSATGRAASNVAVDIAARRRLPLHLVRVWHEVDARLHTPADDAEPLTADQHRERDMLATVCENARDHAPGLAVTGEFVPGDIHASLLERTVGADLLVLGAGGKKGASAGALTRWFIEHAHCPVIAVDAAEHIVEYRAGNALAAVH